MAVVGRGRIVIWEGASLWMLEGEQANAQLRPHAHHAIQLTFLLKGSFEVGVAGVRLTGPVSAVASDAIHNFQANGAVAFLFIAPEGSVGRALGSRLFADRACADMTDELVGALDELRVCYASACDEDDMLRLGRKITATLPKADDVALPDRRVLAMIDYAKMHIDDTVKLPRAAAYVALSESWARHLFVENTGLPFKTYVLWLRLERAVASYAAGSALTAAAHDAGFADSAHFSRTFRRTFGLPAAALQLKHG